MCAGVGIFPCARNCAAVVPDKHLACNSPIVCHLPFQWGHAPAELGGGGRGEEMSSSTSAREISCDAGAGLLEPRTRTLLEPSAPIETSIYIHGAGIGHPPSNAPSLLKTKPDLTRSARTALFSANITPRAQPPCAACRPPMPAKDRRVILRVAPHLNARKTCAACRNRVSGTGLVGPPIGK